MHPHGRRVKPHTIPAVGAGLQTDLDDPLRQRTARAYGRARRRLSLPGSALGLAALVVAALAARAYGGGWGVAALVVLPLAVSTPFGFAGHRLSRRYGISRQTAAGWLADQLKGWLVGAVLGVLCAAGLLAAQRVWPDGWQFPVWLAALLLQAVLVVLFPIVLLPLFLRSSPLDPGPLRDALTETCRRAGVAVTDMRMLAMGEKTAAANAMVAGLGPTARIYVGDTLTEQHDEEGEDVLARARVVLAHELGHHVHRDQLRLLGMAAVQTAVAVLGVWAGVAWVAPSGGGHLSTLPAAVLGFALGQAVATPATAWYSRRCERRADRFAIELTGEGEMVARAFERLARQNLAELDPPALLHLLTGSHPTLRERIGTARA